MDKSILDVVHESAKELHEEGLMQDKVLRELDEICLSPIDVHESTHPEKLTTK